MQPKTKKLLVAAAAGYSVLAALVIAYLISANMAEFGKAFLIFLIIYLVRSVIVLLPLTLPGRWHIITLAGLWAVVVSELGSVYQLAGSILQKATHAANAPTYEIFTAAVIVGCLTIIQLVCMFGGFIVVLIEGEDAYSGKR
jgi:hypothetical protein